MFWTEAYTNGLRTYADLYEDNRLISVKKAADKFKLSWFNFNSLVSAIPKHWKKDRESLETNNFSTIYDKMLKRNNLASFVYKELVNAKSTSPPAVKKMGPRAWIVR